MPQGLSPLTRDQLLLTLMAQVAVSAILATMLVRFAQFRSILLTEKRDWPERLVFAVGLGVPLVAGTDGLAGLTLHRELESWVEAGIPVDDVLLAATLGSARVMKVEKTTGSIKVGKDADLFVVDGDPHAKIGDIRKVTTTMRQGVLYTSKDVYEAVGIRP